MHAAIVSKILIEGSHNCQLIGDSERFYHLKKNILFLNQSQFYSISELYSFYYILFFAKKLPDLCEMFIHYLLVTK